MERSEGASCSGAVHALLPDQSGGHTSSFCEKLSNCIFIMDIFIHDKCISVYTFICVYVSVYALFCMSIFQRKVKK